MPSPSGMPSTGRLIRRETRAEKLAKELRRRMICIESHIAQNNMNAVAESAKRMKDCLDDLILEVTNEN